MSNVVIRKAEREDMEHVLRLIKELAEYEYMPDRVKITAEILERDGFNLPSPLFFCYVAESCNLKIVGYALYYNTYSTWTGKSLFLEDLYVQPNVRRMGIGKRLFLAVAKEAYGNKSRLDFQVLAWNPAMEFYTKFGAENLTKSEQWNSIRLNYEALENIFNKND